MVALRKEGMAPRHWKMISDEVGKDIKPDNPGFNFKYLVDEGLLNHLEICVTIGEKFVIFVYD